MRYLVPQFIERDVKVVGPLTFKQFLFIGGGAGICFILYFTLAAKSFFLFVLIATLIMAISFALAFAKYQNVALPQLIVNFTLYLFKNRVYFWQKQAITPKAYSMPEYNPELEKEKEPHRVAVTRKSKLENLSSQIEI